MKSTTYYDLFHLGIFLRPKKTAPNPPPILSVLDPVPRFLIGMFYASTSSATSVAVFFVLQRNPLNLAAAAFLIFSSPSFPALS